MCHAEMFIPLADIEKGTDSCRSRPVSFRCGNNPCYTYVIAATKFESGFESSFQDWFTRVLQPFPI